LLICILGEQTVTEYKKLNNQPLKFVLAEFRFSPVMEIAKYIPVLQEALRKQYPMPEKKQEQVVQVQPNGINMASLDRWSFMSANKKSAIDINQERLIYATAEYPRFEGFSEACKYAINTLIDIVDPTLILRIGLRYSDLIKVDENEKISDLVDSHFTFPDSIQNLGQAKQNTSETYLKTDIGGLAIRTLYGHHNLSCLPDAKGLPISIKIDDTPSERMILDFDHSWEPTEEPVSFETDEILQKLEALHKVSREAFWKLTTDDARNLKWA